MTLGSMPDLPASVFVRAAIVHARVSPGDRGPMPLSEARALVAALVVFEKGAAEASLALGSPCYVSCANHTCARRSDGSLVCWGYNLYGQLGDSTFTTRTTPTPVPVLMDAVQVEAGANTTCARRASGALLCWGYNNYGQVGDNTRTNRAFPTAVLLLTSAQHVEQGDEFGCAVRTDGTITCWGRGDVASLGDGTLTSRNSANRAIFGLP